MENINIDKTDFNKLLTTVEILIGDVEQMIDQDEVVGRRIEDIKTGRVGGKTEEDYDGYLKKRGVSC